MSIYLNAMESTILEQVALGKTNKEIGEAVFLSTRTVEYHLTSIYKLLSVKSRVEAVKKARELDLIDAKYESLL